MSAKRIALLNGGGDCPGLNAVIRGVVRTASELNWEVFGIHDGFEGLLEPPLVTLLNRRLTSGIMQLGGTILGTTNRGRFVAKSGHGDKNKIPDHILLAAKKTLEEHKIEALICVGGDGSLSSAYQLYEMGIPLVGIPKTIDNDLSATDTTFGFDSAINCVADSFDRLITTARSHRRIMVVETMGRYAGWIALHGGLSGGADIILLPEIPFNMEKVIDSVKRRMSAGYRSTMVVVAEGAKPAGGDFVIKKETGQGGEKRLGGIGEYVSEEIAKNVEWETRSIALGHLQRGGDPTALDRILGSWFGVAAVKLIQEGKFGRMVSYRNNVIGDVPIMEAVGQLKRVQPDGQIVQMAKMMGICFGE